LNKSLFVRIMLKEISNFVMLILHIQRRQIVES